MEKLALDPQAPSLKLSGFKCAARWPDNIQRRRAFRLWGAQGRIGQRAIEPCDRVDERQVVHGNVLSKRNAAVANPVASPDGGPTVPKNIVGEAKARSQTKHRREENSIRNPWRARRQAAAPLETFWKHDAI